VVTVTGAFGLGQPALMAAVTQTVSAEVRGVALGVATLVFFIGAGVGSAVVGGLGEVIGMTKSLGLLALFPLVGVYVVTRKRIPPAEPEPVADTAPSEAAAADDAVLDDEPDRRTA
jgi:predicted MFS family arabinose efflux permease